MKLLIMQIYELLNYSKCEYIDILQNYIDIPGEYYSCRSLNKSSALSAVLSFCYGNNLIHLCFSILLIWWCIVC